jgi:UDP:flavonoid glycosyltransferase YjiC (YdhE family)
LLKNIEFKFLNILLLPGHSNLRAFISHCGQNSLSEAARAGVPVIGIPLFGDQTYNSLVAVQRGMATQLDVGQLNGPNAEAALVEALRKVDSDF